jgi:hypothetical protein
MFSRKSKILFLYTLALTFLIYSYATAQLFVSPSGQPPSSNIPPPINTSEFAQYKTGSFTVNTKISSNHMRSPRYCDMNGNNCLTPSKLYRCPNIDISSTADGDCGSTCVGQVGIMSSCVDYEQFRAGTNDRRCRIRATYSCGPLFQS